MSQSARAAVPLRVSLVLLLLGWAGCLDPLTADRPPPGRLVHPSTFVPPDVEDDDEYVERFEYLKGIVPRLSAFAGGRRIWFWSFDAPGDFHAPIFSLWHCDTDTPVGTPNIVDVIPGDPAYTPLWRLVKACVSPSYSGQVIASRQGLDDALAAGIVSEIRPTTTIVSCPVVSRDALLELAPATPGGPPQYAPPGVGYYREQLAHYFVIMPTVEIAEGVVPSKPLYVLQRIDESDPLDETLVDRDLTGDGDTVDTNDVFSAEPDSADFSSLVYLVSVRVGAEYSGIDTTQDETLADFRSASDLVDGEGRPAGDTVLRITDSDPRSYHAVGTSTPMSAP